MDDVIMMSCYVLYIVPTGVKVKELPSFTPAASSSAGTAKKEDRYIICVCACVCVCERESVCLCVCEGVVCIIVFLSLFIPTMCP